MTEQTLPEQQDPEIQALLAKMEKDPEFKLKLLKELNKEIRSFLDEQKN